MPKKDNKLLEADKTKVHSIKYFTDMQEDRSLPKNKN